MPVTCVRHATLTLATHVTCCLTLRAFVVVTCFLHEKTLSWVLLVVTLMVLEAFVLMTQRPQEPDVINDTFTSTPKLARETNHASVQKLVMKEYMT